MTERRIMKPTLTLPEFSGRGNFWKRFQGEDKRMIFYLDSRASRSMTEKKRLEDSKGESGLEKGTVDI